MAEVFKPSTVKAEEPKTPQYDNNKNYKWTPEDRFVFDGNEFGALYQALRIDILNPGGAPKKQMVDVFQILENALKMAVEAGVAVENTPLSPTPETTPFKGHTEDIPDFLKDLQKNN